MEYLQSIQNNLSSISELDFSSEPIISVDALKSITKKRIRQGAKEEIIIYNDLIPPPPKSISEKYGDTFENYSPIEKLQILESTFHQKAQWIQTVIDLCHLDTVKHESDIIQKDFENHLRILNQHKSINDKLNSKNSGQKPNNQKPEAEDKELVFELKNKTRKTNELKDMISTLNREILELQQKTANFKPDIKLISSGASSAHTMTANEYRESLRRQLAELTNQVKVADTEISNMI